MFYKETEFQDSLIGEIPEDWKIERLEDILLLLRNGLTVKQNKEANGYPITRIETISKEKIDANKIGYSPDVSDRDLKERRLARGDILFSHINSLEHIGKTALYEGTPELLLHGMNLLLLRPKREGIHPEYLLYILKLFKTKNIFWAMSKKAVNQASINQTELGRVRIPIPSLSEQRAIVGVLCVVDSVILKVDEVIAKTERLKKGLMQELLTKGIGHKEYKDTPIGKTPKTWQIGKLGEVCSQRSEIVQPSGEGTNRFIGLEHITSGETVIQSYGSDADLRSSKFRFCSKDILYGKLRPYLDKAILADFDGICSTDLLVLTAQEEALPEFLIYVLHSNEFVKHAIATTTGTNHPRTSWKAISKFEFGLPPLPEQRRIAETLSAVNKKLELEEKEKVRLERVKRGLMDLLLTGKVRVKVD